MGNSQKTIMRTSMNGVTILLFLVLNFCQQSFTTCMFGTHKIHPINIPKSSSMNAIPPVLFTNKNPTDYLEKKITKAIKNNACKDLGELITIDKTNPLHTLNSACFPVHIAVKWKRPDMLQWLLLSGYSPNQYDDRKTMPYDLAMTEYMNFQKKLQRLSKTPITPEFPLIDYQCLLMGYKLVSPLIKYGAATTKSLMKDFENYHKFTRKKSDLACFIAHWQKEMQQKSPKKNSFVLEKKFFKADAQRHRLEHCDDTWENFLYFLLVRMAYNNCPESARALCWQLLQDTMRYKTINKFYYELPQNNHTFAHACNTVFCCLLSFTEALPEQRQYASIEHYVTPVQNYAIAMLKEKVNNEELSFIERCEAATVLYRLHRNRTFWLITKNDLHEVKNWIVYPPHYTFMYPKKNSEPLHIEPTDFCDTVIRCVQ